MSILKNGWPKETDIKYFLGCEVGTMMAPGGSFMTSFEDIISFLAMPTPSNDLIRTNLKKVGIVPEVMFNVENHFTFDHSSINSQASARSSIHASLGLRPRNGTHYGYNCPSHVPFIKTLPSVPQQYICCEDCGGPHETFQSIAITLDLPTLEPEDSLRMRDEHLDTISEMKSDEFIKYSVENLVRSPSVSEDECECDVHACDDFITFFNLLFDVDDDFSSSDDKSFFDENIPKEIYSNPLFDEKIISIKIDPHHFNAESDLIESLLNHDSLIISSSLKIDSLLDEFTGELIFIKSISPGIDESDCDPEEEIHLIEKLLYDNSSPRLPKEFIFEKSNAAVESFSPSPIPIEDSNNLMEEINLSLTPDDSMPPGIEDDDYDSERDILEELLSNDFISLPENESFHFDIPSSPRPPTKPSDDDLGILTVKVVGDIFEHYISMPRNLPTQPTYASNQEKSPHLLSHQGLKTF
nr:hypothetical protein [Tanacetum cinerariifolium]